MIFNQSACVTGVSCIQKPCVKETSCCVSSISRPISVSGLPIRNEPDGQYRNTWFNPRIESSRESPAFGPRVKFFLRVLRTFF